MAFFDEILPLRTGEVARQPWTVLTYPFFQASEFVWFVILLLWLYSIGGGVERELGSRRYTIFWIASSLTGALLFMLGVSVAGMAGMLFGALLPISAVTTVWCARNPTSEVRMFCVLPITGQILGWVTAGVVLFDMGRIHPIVGVFCAANCALAYLFARGKIPAIPFKSPPAKAGPRGKFYSEEYYSDAARRAKEREEKERLRKLLEGDSGSDD